MTSCTELGRNTASLQIISEEGRLGNKDGEQGFYLSQVPQQDAGLLEDLFWMKSPLCLSLVGGCVGGVGWEGEAGGGGGGHGYKLLVH